MSNSTFSRSKGISFSHSGSLSQFCMHNLGFTHSFRQSCQILQPHVAATLRMHSNVVFSSIGDSRASENIHEKNPLKKYRLVMNHFRFEFSSQKKSIVKRRVHF